MTDTAINNTAVTISNTPGTTKVFVANAAVPGYRDFTSAHDVATGKTFTISVKEPGGGDQQFRGCTYTHSIRTIAGGTSEDSSTGGDVSFTSAAVVTVTMSAAMGTDLAARLQSDPLLTVASSGASFSHTVTEPGVIDITLTNSCTLSFSGIPAGAWKIRLILRQGGSGSYTVVWPSGITWDGTGSAPTLRTAVGAYDDIELMSLDGGTTFIARNLRAVPSSGSGTPYGIVHVQNNGSTTQSFTGGTATKVAAILTSVISDPNSWWDATNKKFKPTVAGKYLITVCAQGGAASSQLTAQIYLNGVNGPNSGAWEAAAYCSCFNSQVLQLDGSTDEVEFKVYSSSTTTSNPADVNNYFRAVRIGD